MKNSFIFLFAFLLLSSSLFSQSYSKKELKEIVKELGSIILAQESSLRALQLKLDQKESENSKLLKASQILEQQLKISAQELKQQSQALASYRKECQVKQDSLAKVAQNAIYEKKAAKEECQLVKNELTSRFKVKNKGRTYSIKNILPSDHPELFTWIQETFGLSYSKDFNKSDVKIEFEPRLIRDRFWEVYIKVKGHEILLDVDTRFRYSGSKESILEQHLIENQKEIEQVLTQLVD